MATKIDPKLGYDPADVGNGVFSNRGPAVPIEELNYYLAWLRKMLPHIPAPEFVPVPTMNAKTAAGGDFLPLQLRFEMPTGNGESVVMEGVEAWMMVRSPSSHWAAFCITFGPASLAAAYLEPPPYKPVEAK